MNQLPETIASNKSGKWFGLSLLAAVSALLLTIVNSGCHRKQYRLRSDQQAYHILQEKNPSKKWLDPQFNITPDPRSRFFDPYDPDDPPLPPDDPEAQAYMASVYGMRGPKRWSELQQLSHVENPEWPIFFGGQRLRETGAPLPTITSLTAAAAVEMGLIHSRDYQQQLENTYLAALELTFQRYRFDVRPAGFLGAPGMDFFYQNQPNDQSNFQVEDGSVGVSRLFPSGAQLVVELTNNTIWLLSGSTPRTTASGLAYSLTQPLLMYGSREIVLESLTEAERRVLYAIRDFARYRKNFYVMVLTGSRAVPLPGSSGGGELAYLIRSERSPTVGFYMLLYMLQRVRNQSTNLRSLDNLIRNLVALGEAGRATSLDVTQLLSSYENSRRRLLFLDTAFRDELDRFKLQLGLPPNMDIMVADRLLEPFQFLDSELLDMEDRFGRLGIDTTPRGLIQTIEQLDQFLDGVRKQLQELGRERQQLQQALPYRLSKLSPEDAKTLQDNVSQDRLQFLELEKQLSQLEKQLAMAQKAIAGKNVLTEAEIQTLLPQAREMRRGVLQVVRELISLVITTRVELLILPPVEATEAEITQEALRERLDLMNRRGYVVDARRKVEVAANKMEAVLDIVAEGSLNTAPLFSNDKPLQFNAQDSEFRLGLALQTPLDRRQARNQFRATQISYQRARRNYMAAEDQVILDVRSHLRRVRALAGVFEINRRQLRVAAKELDQAIEFGERPDAAGRAGSRGVNISRALDNILDAQDELIETWSEYETARFSLYRDTGSMQIQPDGIWDKQGTLDYRSIPAPQPAP
jgi:outer membrane protein TolC